MAAVEWRRRVNLEGNGLVSGLLCRKTSVALQPGFYITWVTRSTADWNTQFHPGKPEVEVEVGRDDHAQWHCGLQPWPCWHVLPQLPWLDPHLHQQKRIYCGACKQKCIYCGALPLFFKGNTPNACGVCCDPLQIYSIWKTVVLVLNLWCRLRSQELSSVELQGEQQSWSEATNWGLQQW